MQDLPTALGNTRIAMLIDGENAQPSLIEKMVTEAGKYGLVTVRRIYGDWTINQMKGWKDFLSVHAVQPIQQFRYTTGKNSTDSALIIDAMDILYEGVVTGFCLVSSDSDYTRLATRIREKGFFVMGIGKQNTPRAFVNACQVFVYTENLLNEKGEPKSAQPSTKEASVSEIPADPLSLLKKAIDIALQDDGWAFLAVVGSQLRQLDPGFDPRTYGHNQLSQLIKSYPDVFETRMVRSQKGPSTVYVRIRDKSVK